MANKKKVAYYTFLFQKLGMITDEQSQEIYANLNTKNMNKKNKG
ncbi:hypothetical protein [Alkalihalobacterium bogoriense]|nr:hypothetical protein [Alkalihalobacterium bogoriense]